MQFQPSSSQPSRAQDLRWQSSSARNNVSPKIVFVRVQKKARRQRRQIGHGAWKVAYADFVTAMMAFFILLWMLASTSPVQKAGIASYFDPKTDSNALTSGAGGKLGGRTMTVSGSQLALKAPESLVNKTNQLQDEKKTTGDSPTYSDNLGAHAPRTENSILQRTFIGQGGAPAKKISLSEQQKKTIVTQVEDEEFAKAERQLRQAIQDIPELKDLARNLVIDRTPEGLRIQLVDQEQTAMFPLGSAVFNQPGIKLSQQIAAIAQKLPNEIAITGHTDGNQFRRDDGYSNWELSADRANASRRTLIEFGLAPERIVSVVGKADKELLNATDPLSPINRRISIVLKRTKTEPQEANTPASLPVGNAIPVTVQ